MRNILIPNRANTEEALRTVAAHWMSPVVVGLLLLILVGSFIGRQFLVRPFLMATGLIASISFLVSGFLYVYPQYPQAYIQSDITRTEASRESIRLDRQIEDERSAIRLCKTAVAFYRSPTGKIPTILMQRGRYIAPRISRDDFNEYKEENRVTDVPYYTHVYLVGTAREARERWNTVGRNSYRNLNYSLGHCYAFRKGAKHDAIVPWGSFDLSASFAMAWQVLQVGLLSLIMNLTGAFVGRFRFRGRLRRGVQG